MAVSLLDAGLYPSLKQILENVTAFSRNLARNGFKTGSDPSNLGGLTPF
jgi:hypothetical protein